MTERMVCQKVRRTMWRSVRTRDWASTDSVSVVAAFSSVMQALSSASIDYNPTKNTYDRKCERDRPEWVESAVDSGNPTSERSYGRVAARSGRSRALQGRLHSLGGAITDSTRPGSCTAW